MSTAADVARVEWHREAARAQALIPEPYVEAPDPSEYADLEPPR